MVHLSLTIPFGVKKLWDKWNIRGSILFSLWLQVVLIFVAPIRKSARKTWVILLIWFAYLLADAAANFAVGLISNSQRNQSNNPSQPKPTESTDLLAFWAPFLLLHLGGPDTITAFALEDNQLWLRHLLSLGFQAGAVLYVFIQSLPNDNLWIPTALMFVAGIIKYVERTRALFLASLDKFRDSMLKDPDPGPNYAKLMEEYASKKDAKLPTRIDMTPEPDKESKASDAPPKEGDLDHLEVVHYAYDYFQIFKGLVVDLILSFRERDESRDFFTRRTAEDALRIIEVELNFLYGTLYTKVEVVHSTIGYIFRFIAFGANVATLGIFYFQTKKDEFQGVDIGITYTLLLGAVALDVVAFLMLIFSDRTFASIFKYLDSPYCRPIAAVFGGFLALKKPRWHRCKKCGIKNSDDPHPHQALITPLGFRRWSGSISAHNLIRYCLKSRRTTIHEFPSLLVIMFEKFLHLLGIDKIIKKVGHGMTKIKRKISPRNTFVPKGVKSFNCSDLPGSIVISKVIRFLKSILEKVNQFFSWAFKKITKPVKDLVDEMMYVSSEPFTLELWNFIFQELKNKSEFADNPETAKRISAARGDWVLTDTDSGNDRSKLLKYVSDVQYDESLLLWHIATDLCYYTDKEEEMVAEQEFSKTLSDYMLYLLIFQPTTMSAVAGIGKIRYRDTCAEAERFFERRSLRPNEDKKACDEILSVNTDVVPATVKGDRSKSVLFDASMLAKELKGLGRKDKWNLICRVWVELVSYAASHCRASTHAQGVSKGGELITFFWLLMAHFGLGEQFQINEGHARAKLIVGK
ncbi:uncharacterized protein LOC110414256 [Herrania umbratica]|uniref:Uncharacterized protein LOC110414256 n=1 Tax=Herrania umbratica TaxID=108875 RepID=A0A6J1A266_9ROSI|nr:uncharacterized protein LOC110414256 [Herrania umbratica]